MKWLLSLSVSLCMTVPAMAAESTVEPADWTESVRPELEMHYGSVAQVEALLKQILPPVPPGDRPLEVESFEFASLGRRGSVQMICIVGDGARFHPTVLVVERTGNRFSYTEAYNGGAMDLPPLRQLVVDVDKEGHKALLIPRRLGPYRGVQPVPLFYDLYTYRNHRLLQSDLQFLDYYRSTLIPKLQLRAESLEREPSTGIDDIENRKSEEIRAVRESVSAMKKALGMT